jgi:pentapeptide repeat protein
MTDREIALLVAALFGLAAWLWLGWRRARAAEAGARATAALLAGAEIGRRAERLSIAIEQLAHEQAQVRLGAVYVLEGLARESAEVHWPVIEILCAFIRERSHWKENSGPAHFGPDLQAALTVIGRRGRDRDRAGDALDLVRSDLRGADLKGLDLRGARLVEVHLEEASLAGAELEGADLRRANLARADLVEANLRGANLREANLEAAYLVEAHLENADLVGAHLEGAYLGGAHLEGADLGSAHLDGAYLYKANLEGASLHGARVLSTIGMSRGDREAFHRNGSNGAGDDEADGGSARSGGAA